MSSVVSDVTESIEANKFKQVSEGFFFIEAFEFCEAFEVSEFSEVKENK